MTLDGIAKKDSVYKVLPIEGKGLGCIALKEIKMGTLILQEIPQCSPIESQKELTIDFFNPTKSETELSIDFLSNLLDSFRNMSESDQALFMNLHNRFQNVTNFNDKTKESLGPNK